MSAQQQMIAKYGPPSALYVKKYCVVWDVQTGFPWFPVTHFLVNEDFKAILVKAFTNLQDADLQHEIKTFDGCYNDRSVRGSDSTSMHAWAAAIDLNAACDGMVDNPTPQQREGTWSPQFIAAMKAAGLYYGGDFKVRADPMHFSMLDG